MNFRQLLATRPFFLVLFVLAKIVMAIGMASAAPVSSGLSEAEKAAYMLPDGTLPVFCLTGDDGDNASHVMCDGCGCSSAALGAPFVALLDVDYLGKLALLPNANVIIKRNDLASQARAPPFT